MHSRKVSFLENLLLNPSSLFPLLWVSVIVASNLSGIDFYPFSKLFYRYIFYAVVVFFVCSFLPQICLEGLRTPKNREFHDNFQTSLSEKFTANAYIICMLISLVFQAIDHWSFAGPIWWTPAGLIIYRVAVTELAQTAHFQFIALLNFFFFSAVPMLLVHKKLGWHRRIAIVFLLTVYVYLSTARASLFTILLIGLFFYLHTQFSLKLVTFAAISLFVLFAVLGGIVSKSSSGHGPDLFWLYLFAPAHALDQILNGLRTDTAGVFYTLRPLHGLFLSLGLISPQPVLISYYETPYRTNVFTLFGPYVLDYGWVASLIWLGFFGFLSGLLYSFAKAFPDDAFLTFLSSLNLSILMLGIFYDYYTSSSYVWISIVAAFIFFGRYPYHRLKERFIEEAA